MHGSGAGFSSWNSNAPVAPSQNDAYLQACAASGVMPQPVPAVPGVYPTPAEPSTSDSEADRINQQLNKLDMEKARKHILKVGGGYECQPTVDPCFLRLFLGAIAHWSDLM
jgi:hypothetical protein